MAGNDKQNPGRSHVPHMQRRSQSVIPAILRTASFEATAFYWELPPLTNTTIDNDVEFVLIDAPSLVRLRPEPAPFRSLFEQSTGEDVIVFPNLGGDAALVAPCPREPIDVYPHLATFLRPGQR